MEMDESERIILVEQYRKRAKIKFPNHIVHATVHTIVENLAAGSCAEEIMKSYPSLNVDDIKAAISYATEISRERVVGLPA